VGVSSAFFCLGRANRTTVTGKREGKEFEIYRDIPDDLRSLIEPVVDEHACELVNVEQSGGSGAQGSAGKRGRGLLRITVDNPNADGRVPIEVCVQISREVETLLDATEAIPGAYQLEVSSPGLDRVLGREKDFEKVIGSEVKLRTNRPIEGRKRFRGRLVGFDDGMLKLKVDGEDALIPFEAVEKANSIYEFTSADFSKKSAKEKKHAKKSR